MRKYKREEEESVFKQQEKTRFVIVRIKMLKTEILSASLFSVCGKLIHS